MPSRTLRTRFWAESALAALAAALAVVTIAVPTWIEAVFGVEPDGGSGELEWLVVVVLALVAVGSAALAGREWRRAALAG
ncbi:hypothetical protein OEB99_19605 [Actinotalea sp. M2MS4P-6]|uniref:hypothetical protein n=1 Tax=Actinotalea sp. M2MS4P-6 TaxID=2983762 RepID=UPI0021E50C99|nr:hypothetical protein [Actinotalea sp. M2MS4P-6]MCV2396522.1 hypothetical protein [Actinotalea sp. M2MS4P-6]